MTLNLSHFLLLGVLCTSLHWLLARSEIFKFAWSRAPGWLDKLLRCPSCSGFWLGLGLGAAGIRPVEGVSVRVVIMTTGLIAVVLTPVVEAILLAALERSAIDATERMAEDVEGDEEKSKAEKSE